MKVSQILWGFGHGIVKCAINHYRTVLGQMRYVPNIYLGNWESDMPQYSHLYSLIILGLDLTILPTLRQPVMM